jgi:predicted MPP superfamily phosphohydrolase
MRIVAVSDLHGHLPDIPSCDLLIVAGDICPDRFGPFFAGHAPEQQARWFEQHVRPWLDAAPAVHKVATWGNHDWCGERCDFSHYAPAASPATTLQILVDKGTRIPRRSEGRPTSRGWVRVWGTPWSNVFMQWAFMKRPAALAAAYARIPAGIDILVSHQPPWGYGDSPFDPASGKVEHLGSRELLAAIERVRPGLVICGHIHGGHGRYEHDGIPIYNVSVVDEQYRLVHAPTVIEAQPVSAPP